MSQEGSGQNEDDEGQQYQLPPIITTTEKNNNNNDASKKKSFATMKEKFDALETLAEARRQQPGVGLAAILQSANLGHLKEKTVRNWMQNKGQICDAVRFGFGNKYNLDGKISRQIDLLRMQDWYKNRVGSSGVKPLLAVTGKDDWGVIVNAATVEGMDTNDPGQVVEKSNPLGFNIHDVPYVEPLSSEPNAEWRGRTYFTFNEKKAILKTLDDYKLQNPHDTWSKMLQCTKLAHLKESTLRDWMQNETREVIYDSVKYGFGEKCNLASKEKDRVKELKALDQQQALAESMVVFASSSVSMEIKSSEESEHGEVGGGTDDDGNNCTDNDVVGDVDSPNSKANDIKPSVQRNEDDEGGIDSDGGGGTDDDDVDGDTKAPDSEAKDVVFDWECAVCDQMFETYEAVIEHEKECQAVKSCYEEAAAMEGRVESNGYENAPDLEKAAMILASLTHSSSSGIEKMVHELNTENDVPSEENISSSNNLVGASGNASDDDDDESSTGKLEPIMSSGPESVKRKRGSFMNDQESEESNMQRAFSQRRESNIRTRQPRQVRPTKKMMAMLEDSDDDEPKQEETTTLRRVKSQAKKSPKSRVKGKTTTKKLNDKQNSQYSSDGVVDPGPNDCLFGRGEGTNRHPGNKRFRSLIETKKGEYLAAKIPEKQAIAIDLVHVWRGQSPPGRFLKQDEDTKLWHDVGDQKARKKVSASLRETRYYNAKSPVGVKNKSKQTSVPSKMKKRKLNFNQQLSSDEDSHMKSPTSVSSPDQVSSPELSSSTISRRQRQVRSTSQKTTRSRKSAKVW